MNACKFLALAVSLSLLTSCGHDTGHAKSDLLKLNYQFTPEDFVRAARAGDEKAVQLFLDGGMDVNSAAATGETALIGAAENNATKIIQLLTKQGAAFDQKDKEGWTPLMKAIYANKVEAIRLLANESKEDLNRGLLLASLLGYTDAAKALLQSGAEVDTTSPEGKTPLSYARKSGNRELESVLLEAGAEAKTEDTPAEEAPAKDIPAPTPSLAEKEALLKDLATMKKSSEEAWWKKYGLDLTSAEIFSEDKDGDGFTNSEEFLADTSPIDPSSHPAAAAKLTWQAYHRESLPYRLEKVEKETAVLRDSAGATVQARAGDTVGDWTIAQVRTRKSYDKDGHAYDGSDLLVKDPAGQKIRLVPGIQGPANASYAEVKLPFSEESQHLRNGEEFTLPNDGNRRYLVLDLREEQVVVKETTTGQTFTISKTP